MGKTKAIILMFVLLAFSAAMFAGDAKPMAAGQTRTVRFSAETLVGTAALPAGEYKVEHLMDGAQHVLVFKGTTGKKAEARVNCKMEASDASNQDLQLFTTGSKGEKILTTLIFRGDTSKHVIER